MSSIHPTAQIASGVILKENVVVGAGVKIGIGTVIGNGCVIHDDTLIGAHVNVLDNSVLGRTPQRISSMTRAPHNDLGPLQIGDGCVIGACVVLYRGVVVGGNTLLGDLCSIREECEVGSNSIVGRGVTVNYATRIGNRVKIQDNTHITGNMVIEDGVFISTLVATVNDNAMDRGPRDPAKFGGPIIKQGASIGAGAILLPGIVVGEYAVVGAGAVVSYDVPPSKIVVGNPARVVKNVPAEWIPNETRPIA